VSDHFGYPLAWELATPAITCWMPYQTISISRSLLPFGFDIGSFTTLDRPLMLAVRVTLPAKRICNEGEAAVGNPACTLVVGIRLSDMHRLHIRVRHSRSFDLSSSLLLSKLDLLHLVFPLMLLPNLSTGYVILFSLVFLLSSKLVPYYLSYCGYMLLFRCINSRPSWPSEIE